MALGVFVHRTDSIYDDSPAERYQFPAQYLGRASACVGDWVLYYEPVKVRARRGEPLPFHRERNDAQGGGLGLPTRGEQSLRWGESQPASQMRAVPF